MKKIKAYIIYGGSPDWYNATLIFENGWAAFGHLCSHPCFMPGDLWLHRKERQDILTEMGYEVELVGDPIAGSNNPLVPEGLTEKNASDVNWKEMAEEYDRIYKRNHPAEGPSVSQPSVEVEVTT